MGILPLVARGGKKCLTEQHDMRCSQETNLTGSGEGSGCSLPGSEPSTGGAISPCLGFRHCHTSVSGPLLE